MNCQIKVIPAIVALCFVQLLSVFDAVGQEPSNEGLEEVLTNLCRQHNVPSLTVGVVRAGESVTTKCVGVRKRGTNDLVSLTDRHPLGSCTKSMTATLAAVVVEAGDITWDTTIGEVWPRAGAKHLHPELRDVTLGELLSHQGGLKSDLSGTDWLSFFTEEKQPTAERRRMLKLVLKAKPEHPRGEYHYSNLGYVVVAAMLESRTKERYEGMMHRLLFRPLGMESADFRTMAAARKLQEPLLWGHMADGQPINPQAIGAENPSVYASCGTVNLTVTDYLRYAQWRLRNKPAPVLTSQDTLAYLGTAKVDASSTGGKYGAGWIILDMPRGRAWTHGGSNTNSFALIWVLPDSDFAAVALTNTGESGAFPACNAAIVDLMVRYAQKDNR